jgi:hypothetical protein
MWIQMNPNIAIEDVGHHTVENVEKLRALLATGAPAKTDPQRKSFYEVENCSRVYYIHLCPNGKVLLLAVWAKEGFGQHPHLAAQAGASASL